jgi:uncharacterized membrane protein
MEEKIDTGMQEKEREQGTVRNKETERELKTASAAEHKTNPRAEESRRLLLEAGSCVIFVFFFGLLLELFCNLSLLHHEKEGNFSIPLSNVEYKGFQLEQGGRLRLTEEAGTIRIPVGTYVGELACSYDYDGLLNMTAKAYVENEYGEIRERDAEILRDKNPKTIQTAWIPVGKEADCIELSVSRGELYEPGLSYIDFASMPLEFTGFEAVTEAAVNPFRLCFFWCLAGTAVFLIVCRRWIGRHAEAGFLIIALTGGLLFSLSLPANKVGFDEEIHFEQSFWIAHYRNPVQLSPTVFQEFSAGIDTWPLNQPGGLREQQALDKYLDQTGDYRNGSIRWSADLNKATFTGYLGQAAFLKAGEILHLPFSMLFKLGRLGNLFIYVLVMALAIRKTPVGKGMLAFIGLMPAPMMLAGVYSYDPTVTAFTALSCAYMLEAMLNQERRLSVRDFVILTGAFFWGCRIKAVYAPLILMGFLIPAERFETKKKRNWMRAGFAVMFLLMMASFVLPVLISPSETGDLRGGATSETGQMAYVLGQPLAYAAVLFKNIFASFPSYVLGEGVFGTLGHLGVISFPWLLYAASAAVILTDTGSSCGKKLTKSQRVWIFLLAGVCAVLVWTSMYIAFTPPGNTYIEGVQGRYYLPFLFMVWLAVSPSCVQVKLKNSVYYPLVLALAGVVFYAVYAADVLSVLCL